MIRETTNIAYWNKQQLLPSTKRELIAWIYVRGKVQFKSMCCLEGIECGLTFICFTINCLKCDIARNNRTVSINFANIREAKLRKKWKICVKKLWYKFEVFFFKSHICGTLSTDIFVKVAEENRNFAKHANKVTFCVESPYLVSRGTQVLEVLNPNLNIWMWSNKKSWDDCLEKHFRSNSTTDYLNAEVFFGHKFSWP